MTPTPAITVPPYGPRSRDPWFYGWRYVTRTAPDGTTSSEQVPLTAADVLHPQEDDFIVTNEAHDRTCNYLKAVFRWRLRDRRGALVLKDHRIDWQAADLEPHGPDVTVLYDSPPWNVHRGTYRVRDAGATPALVVEVTSESTRNNDLDDKVTHYWRVGIPQYVIVDSQEEDTGWQVSFLVYRPGPDGPVRQVLPEPNRVWLPAVELWLAAEGDLVVCLLPDGTPVNDFPEVMAELLAVLAERDALEAERDALAVERDGVAAERDAERQRADTVAAERDDMLRRNQELEAELRRLRGDTP